MTLPPAWNEHDLTPRDQPQHHHGAPRWYVCSTSYSMPDASTPPPPPESRRLIDSRRLDVVYTDPRLPFFCDTLRWSWPSASNWSA